MRPDTLPELSGRNNPERISYMDLIIKELACIKVAIEKIDQIIDEFKSRPELTQQIEEIISVLNDLFSYVVNTIEAHRQETDWNTINNEIKSYVEESNIYHSQTANDPNLQLKILLGYIFNRLIAARVHAGNLYNTPGVKDLIGKLDYYKTKIDKIYKSLYGGVMK